MGQVKESIKKLRDKIKAERKGKRDKLKNINKANLSDDYTNSSRAEVKDTKKANIKKLRGKIKGRRKDIKAVRADKIEKMKNVNESSMSMKNKRKARRDIRVLSKNRKKSIKRRESY